MSQFNNPSPNHAYPPVGEISEDNSKVRKFLIIYDDDNKTMKMKSCLQVQTF